MNAAGIIFSNLHDRNIPELTRVRTVASVPFACRYRFIDFPLSNMVNAGITNINVITHYNYHSLMDHIGTGKDWDLARRSGGIKILPPYITAYANAANQLYTNRLEALMSVNYTISRLTEEYVVISDCDILGNIDLSAIINEHIKSGADMTMAVKEMDIAPGTGRHDIVIRSDEYGRITDIIQNASSVSGKCDVALNVWVLNTKLLSNFVTDAVAHGFKSFSRDIVMRNIDRLDFRVYKVEGYAAFIHSFEEYYANSMDIIENEAHRKALFGISDRPIFTKVRNSPPTRYASGSDAKKSLIADGCIINGSVENCILFRGVRIGRGAKVKNCILFQDTVVGDGVELNCVVSDKNAVIRDGTQLVGMNDFPLYIDKGRMI